MIEDTETNAFQNRTTSKRDGEDQPLISWTSSHGQRLTKAVNRRRGFFVSRQASGNTNHEKSCVAGRILTDGDPWQPLRNASKICVVPME